MGLCENAFIAKMGSCENALLLQKELNSFLKVIIYAYSGICNTYVSGDVNLTKNILQLYTAKCKCSSLFIKGVS